MSDFNPYSFSYRPFGKTNTKYNLTRHLTWMVPNDLYIWKLTCRCVFLNKREVLFLFLFLWEIQHFQICFHVPDTFLWLLNYERYVHVCASFRCIFLICSCHLSKHPSQCELFWYPRPDDGYWNWNVNLDFKSKYIHQFGLCFFFLLPSYCRILIYIYFHIYIYIYTRIIK